MSKITAIMGGGDWADVSVEFVVLPDGVRIEDVEKKYKKWVKDEYGPSLRRSLLCSDVQGPVFYTLAEWCIEKEGGTKPTEDQLEEFWNLDISIG